MSLKSLSALIEQTAYNWTNCDNNCPFNSNTGHCRLFGKLNLVIDDDEFPEDDKSYYRHKNCLKLEEE